MKVTWNVVKIYNWIHWSFSGATVHTPLALTRLVILLEFYRSNSPYPVDIDPVCDFVRVLREQQSIPCWH